MDDEPNHRSLHTEALERWGSGNLDEARPAFERALDVISPSLQTAGNAVPLLRSVEAR